MQSAINDMSLKREKNTVLSDDKGKLIFNQQMTTAIKGVAICVMLFHHFFGFPSWLQEDVSFYGIPFNHATIEYYLAVAGKICVAMYTFLSGYGLFISYQRRDKAWDIQYLLKKTLQLLINWWLIVLIVELPVMVCYKSVGGGITQWLLTQMFLSDLTGNPFVGYLKFYLLALWTSPVLYQTVRKCKHEKSYIILLPLAGMVLRKICWFIFGEIGLLNTYILYIPYFFSGMLICKSQLYQEIYHIIKDWKCLKFVTGVGILGVIILRSLTGEHALSFDSWFATILIFLIAVCFQKKSKARRFFEWLGKYSTNLWYSHAVWIFGSVTMQRILYAPKAPLIILVWGIALCMPGALIVCWIMKKISF